MKQVPPEPAAAGTFRSYAARLVSRSGQERPAATFLFLFAAALVLPLLLLASIVGWTYVQGERTRTVERAQSRARELSVAIDHELNRPRRALEVLATSEVLRRGDLQAFQPTASAIADALAMTIAVRAAGGQTLLSTAFPSGTTPPQAKPDVLAFDAQVIREKKPAVTNAIAGSVGKGLVVEVIVPVLRDGAVVYLLAADLPVESLQAVLVRANLDEGWLATVLDANDTIVARSADPEGFIGKKAPEEWRKQATATGGAGWSLGLQDNQVVVAYERSSAPRWLTVVSVPPALINAPLWRALAFPLAAGILLLLAAAALAAWAGAHLMRAVKALQIAGLELEEPGRVSPVATPVREINDVGRVLARAATAAQRREALLRSILATVPSAMVVIDSRGRVQLFSATAEKLFGFKADEVVGENIRMLMPEPDRSAHDGYIEHYLMSGERRILGTGRVVVAQRKDGSKFPVELYVGEAKVDAERLFIGFLRDQTEKYRVEQQLRQTQKMEAIGKLTGGVAHDFNNLLTVITGNLEMLGAKVDDRYQALIREAQEAAEVAAQLTSSLLAFGRRMPLDSQLADIGDLISVTSELLRRTLGETIVVRTSIRSGCRAVVDAAQLKNAILNLAINARDAMPNGGTLSLEVTMAELDKDYALGHPEVRPGRYVLITVTDTGTGMTRHVREHAFEPFFTTKPQGSGTGLGLSSVYGFVKQSGGHVALYSEATQGTTVRIYLPLVAEESDRPQADAAEPGLPKGNGQLVLAVEDDEGVRRVTVSRLMQLGYNVVEAASGPEALAVLQRTPDVGLVITDMVMPGGMTGADLAAATRERFPNLPVLFTSGYAGPEISEHTNLRLGDWLRKPYTLAEMAMALHRMFNRSAC